MLPAIEIIIASNHLSWCNLGANRKYLIEFIDKMDILTPTYGTL